MSPTSYQAALPRNQFGRTREYREVPICVKKVDPLQDFNEFLWGLKPIFEGFEARGCHKPALV